MKSKATIVKLVCLCALLLVYSSPLYAQGNDPAAKSPWEVDLLPRLFWGVDFAGVYNGFDFFAGVNTGLELSLSGARDDGWFQRNPDGTVYTPPTDGSPNLARYKRVNYLWSLGYKQGIIFDRANGRNLVEFFGLYKGRYDQNLPEESPSGSLIFKSNLPDRYGIRQNSILAGFSYQGVVQNTRQHTKKGMYAEMSLEIAPKSFANEHADFRRLNVNVLGFSPLVERDGINVYFGDRVMFDLLDGGYIPIDARTTFGGLVPFPGLQVPGLGGAIRGVGTNLFDGYIKAVNNFEVRANSQRLMNDYFKPELILYFDTGVYDNLTRKVDFNNLLSSTGAGLDFDVLGMDLILYVNYFLNEKKPSIGLALGDRF